MDKLIDNLPHLKNRNKIKKIDNFSNNNKKGLDNTELLGVNISPGCKLSGSEVDFNQHLNISSNKTDDENIMAFLKNNNLDNNIMTFLSNNNILNKPENVKDMNKDKIPTDNTDIDNEEPVDEEPIVEEPVDKEAVDEEPVDEEPVDDKQSENFSNYQLDFKMDYIGNFYVTSLSLIMIYYIFKSLRR